MEVGIIVTKIYLPKMKNVTLIVMAVNRIDRKWKTFSHISEEKIK